MARSIGVRLGLFLLPYVVHHTKNNIACNVPGQKEVICRADTPALSGCKAGDFWVSFN